MTLINVGIQNLREMGQLVHQLQPWNRFPSAAAFSWSPAKVEGHLLIKVCKCFTDVFATYLQIFIPFYLVVLAAVTFLYLKESPCNLLKWLKKSKGNCFAINAMWCNKNIQSFLKKFWAWFLMCCDPSKKNATNVALFNVRLKKDLCKKSKVHSCVWIVR